MHYLVRKQVVQDLTTIANNAPAKYAKQAALELALCYRLAFGTARDEDASLRWLRISGRTANDLADEIQKAQQRRDYRGPFRLSGESEHLDFNPGLDYQRTGLLDDAIATLRVESEGKEGISEVVHSQLLLQSHLCNALTQRGTDADDKEHDGLRKRIAEMTEVVQGPNDLNTLLALTLYAKTLTDFGKAEEIGWRVLKARRKIHPDRHPDILYALDNLGVILLRKEECSSSSQALTLLREARAGTTAVFGESHPRSFLTGRHLARALAKESHLSEAEELLKDTLVKAKAFFVESHYEVSSCEKDLTSVLLKAGKTQEALDVAQAALRGQSSAYEMNSERHIRDMITFVSRFLEENEPGLVLDIQRGLVDLLKRKSGVGERTAAQLRRLGLMLYQGSRTKEAVSVYEEYIHYQKSLSGPTDETMVSAVIMLAVMYRQCEPSLSAVTLLCDLDVSALTKKRLEDVLDISKRTLVDCSEQAWSEDTTRLQRKITEMTALLNDRSPKRASASTFSNPETDLGNGDS